MYSYGYDIGITKAEALESEEEGNGLEWVMSTTTTTTPQTYEISIICILLLRFSSQAVQILPGRSLSRCAAIARPACPD